VSAYSVNLITLATMPIVTFFYLWSKAYRIRSKAVENHPNKNY